MSTLITGATIVNEGKTFKGSLLIAGDSIAEILKEGETPSGHYCETIDATGCFVIPGVIDDHVHFREPGLTQKADIESESRAAAYGGVTSYFDMPNTIPQTTTISDLQGKFDIAAEKSHVNYSFFFGVTNTNIRQLEELDRHSVPGLKLFMGSSTGNMLVDKEEALDDLFRMAKMPIMAHCEDTQIINANMEEAKRIYGDDPDIALHPKVRSESACYESTKTAVGLARKYGSRLHVAHVTTAKEFKLFECPENQAVPNITAEVTVAHLLFDDSDYTKKGALIKCNPAVKTSKDRNCLREAIKDGRVFVVGTDHAPHCLSEKQGGCAKAVSGMPMLQFSLVSMLKLVDEGVISIERLVELMCHNPARLFDVDKRGFIRKGYKADIAIVRPNVPWKLTKDVIQSKCGWSPLEGESFTWKVEHTFCNGRHIYNNGVFDSDSRGEQITFRGGC